MKKKYFGYEVEEILPIINTLIMQNNSLMQTLPVEAEIIKIDKTYKAKINLGSEDTEFDLGFGEKEFLIYEQNKETSLFCIVDVKGETDKDNGYVLLCVFESTLERSEEVLNTSIVELFIECYKIKNKKQMEKLFKRAYAIMKDMFSKSMSEPETPFCVLQKKNWIKQ